MTDNHDHDDMTEDEFDAEFAAGEPAELDFDHRVRVTWGVSAARTDVGRTWAAGPGKMTRLVGPSSHTVTASVVLSSAHG